VVYCLDVNMGQVNGAKIWRSGTENISGALGDIED